MLQDCVKDIVYNHQRHQHHDYHQKHHHHHNHHHQPDGVSRLVVSPTAPGFDPLCVSESSASDDLTIKVLLNDDGNRDQAPQKTCPSTFE